MGIYFMNSNLVNCTRIFTLFSACFAADDPASCYYKYLPPIDANVKQKLTEEREKVEHSHEIINDLKEELRNSKAKISTMAKDIALLTDALQSLRTKYKSIKIFRKDAIAQIEILKKTNCELCRKLEQDLKCHAEKVKHTKNRQGTNIEHKVKHDANKLLVQSEEYYQKMVHANEKLIYDCEQLKTKYLDARNEIEDLKTLLNSHNQKNASIHQESEDLKSLLQDERSNNAMMSKIKDQLEKTIGKLMRADNKAQIEMNELKKQKEELEQCKCELTYELNEKDTEYHKLECECETLKKQMNDFTNEDILKCKKFEKEIDRLKKALKDKEFEIEEQHRSLTSLIQELNELIRRHKARIKELIIINTTHEGLIKSQNIIIRNKEHEVKMSEVEVQAAKIQCEHLKQQIEKLQRSLKAYETVYTVEKQKEAECKNRVEHFRHELDTTKQMLREEKDKLLIKEKIIEDQADTIKKLKNNMHDHGDELRQRNSKIIQLQTELDNEKYDKKQFQENIEEITWHKEQLKDKITKLEHDLEEERTKLPLKIDHQKKKLTFLKQQFTMKQKEYELNCNYLSEKKKQAVQAAEFATQELMDTVNDFQTYADSQKQERTIITKLFQSKNDVRKFTCQKITKSKDMSMIKSSAAVTCIKNCPSPRRQISFR